jgi:hypothetical protein
MKRVIPIGLALLFVFGCRTNMAPLEAGSVTATRRVLIAGEDTPFKRKVVARLIEDLGTRDWYFRIVGLDQADGQENERYGAIVLIAGYRAGRIDQRVSRFLRKDPTSPRVVVFYTRGTEDPMPDRSKPDLKVDSISSASRDDRVELRAGQLAALIAKRFQGGSD